MNECFKGFVYSRPSLCFLSTSRVTLGINAAVEVRNNVTVFLMNNVNDSLRRGWGGRRKKEDQGKNKTIRVTRRLDEVAGY